jgi:putative endonuclease
MAMYWMYILYSDTLNKFYIGSTNNLQRRLHEHNIGKSTYTKKGKPWRLILSEQYDTRNDAWKREMVIKSYKGGIQFKQLLQIGGVA